MLRVYFTVLVCIGLVACSKSDSPAPTTTAHPIHREVAKAKALIAAGATVIDVRTPAEFAEGHVSTATSIPIEQFADRISEVNKLVGGDRTKPIVVYASGRRAYRAQLALEAAGYTQVVDGGGYDDLL